MKFHVFLFLGFKICWEKVDKFVDNLVMHAQLVNQKIFRNLKFHGRHLLGQMWTKVDNFVRELGDALVAISWIFKDIFNDFIEISSLWYLQIH